MNQLDVTPTVSFSVNELEVIIQRAVRKAVREEFSHLLQRQRPSIGDDWSQEGEPDPEGDRALLAEALEMLRRYKGNREGWKSWEVFKVELEQAEAAGELPN